MCGIAGIFSGRRLPQETGEHLEAMLEAIRHRGPDGRGTFIEHDHGVALGHARLSIIDLETGAQPLSSPDKRHVLTVNGEFYNFREHRVRLMADGDRFACKSDSEIALNLYRRHGIDFLGHLRGEFAFALYDHTGDELLLVRDRFGIRPLFFTVRDGVVYYGSEVKALLAHPDVPARLDRRAALNQLMHTMVPGTSAFEGVEAVRPGHYLRVRRRDGSLDISQHRYWDLEFPLKAERGDDPDAGRSIALVRETLSDAVIQRLVADVPVGCYLSGGIDSCCILGLATGAQQSPVKAFTISFDHDDYDEAAIAREMAESMGAEQELINLSADDLYGENFIRTVWHAERTFYNTLGVAKYLMSKRVNECGYKTVITGEGSDELFGGYPAFKRDMFLHGLADEPEDERRRLEEALARSNRLFRGAILAENEIRHPAFDDLCGFTPSWIQSWLATLDIARPLMSDDALAEIGDYDPVAAIAAELDPGHIRGRHALDIAQYTWSKTMLEGQILNWGGDRVDMANSMESRPAFLDHHVAEAATRIAPHFRIHGNVEKWVLREAVKGVLPKVLYEREKFAFMAPPAHTDASKRARVGDLIERFLNPDSLGKAGLLDPGRVSQFLAEYRADTDPVSLTRKDALLNHLLCLQILDDHFC